MILEAAEAILAESGLAGLSAREIARRIGYSPGTIYNVFRNLDDVVLNVEARVLDRLADSLGAPAAAAAPAQAVRHLAATYLRFTHDNPKLWGVLFEHHLPPGERVPDWYIAKLDLLLSRVEQALAPAIGANSPEATRRAARVLWAGVHGIASLSVTDKLAIVSTAGAATLVDDLVTTYLDGLIRPGLTSRQRSRSANADHL